MKRMFWCSVFIIAIACSQAKDDAKHAAHAGHASEPAPVATAPSGHSIFHLDSHWTTQGGDEIALSELSEKILVLAMVYTHCEFACPRILADMRHIRSKLAGNESQIEFVLVSIDPARDTPQRLAEFAATSKLATNGWTLLHGDEGSIRELAAVLGVQYRRIDEQDFSHSNLISVLNRDGEVVYQQVGLGVDPIASVEAIQGLLALGEAGSPRG